MKKPIKKMGRTSFTKMKAGISEVRNFINVLEIQLCGWGSIDNWLKAWKTTKTVAKTANVLIEGGPGTKSLGDAIVE
jgi:hypothetical protein